MATPDETELTEADKDTIHYTFPDGTTTTNKSKGKNYKPKKKYEDKRQAGAKKRSNTAKARTGLPYGNSADRITGKEELDKLARGFTENKTIYEGMESKIFNSSKEIEKLIESLEKVNESKTQ